jgi:hypothetical protein
VQRIRFGLTLDGERGWHARDALGDSTVGPLGLLNVLETQLGLTRAVPSPAERVVQMRECLEAACNGARFYEKSFEVDELGTSATILAWRDLWYEHGWDGSVPPASTVRLRDMSAIDALALTRVFPGIGQRLNEIAALLPLRRPQIKSIEHLEPLEEFPLTWQRVLAHLPATRIRATPTIPLGPAGSMLHALQAAALQMAENRAGPKIPWRHDDSVCIARAESRLAAAQWMASQARLSPGADRVLVIEQSGATVDAALAAMDQPLLGASDPSAFRPTLQLLPLALRLVWDPLDFRALLQFLTHPVGPIRSFARRTLAEKIASCPGIGGEAWQRAIQTIEAHYAADGAKVISDIEFWLKNPRFAANEPAPLELAVERVARLAHFFRQRMADTDAMRRASCAAGYQQAAAMEHALKALQQQGVTGIARGTLDRLVSQATAFGCDNPLLRTERAARCYVRAPSAVIESFDEVCWWHMSAVPLAKRHPWSPRELQQLRGMGVELPYTSTVLEREARGWLRPILAARGRLTLMLPRSGEEVHPAWLMLSSLIEDPTIIDVESVLTGDSTTHSIATVQHRPLPQRRRWWQLPAGAIHGWDRSASFSSLDQFFNNPCQWALNYPARLKASAVLEVPGDFRLLGNLAHRMVEQLYRHDDAISWSVQRVHQWFDQAVDRIVREEGAVLLMSGRRADLESFRARFRDSLVQLHSSLQAAGAMAVEPEKSLEGDTLLGSLRGSSDLLVTLTDGRQAIIDMKWAGNTKYRKKLNEQMHIQLAIYARLVENNTSAWPAVAYFILERPELLTTAAAVFPGVTPISPPGTSTSLLWDRITATWAWRRAQIEAGSLELVMEGLEPTAASQPPAGALAIEELNQQYNACANLVGWDADA